MADLYRRCGCRRPGVGGRAGQPFPPLADRPTEAQRAAACPSMLTDPKHGRWGFVVSGGFDPGSGKRIQVRKGGFPTKREAQQERARTIDQLATGRYRTDRRATVGTWVPEWLDRRVRDGKLRPSSERMYRRYVEQDIVPRLGRLKLVELRRFHVDQFIQDLTRAGRGATTVHRIHAVLSSALSAAVRLDLIEFNPASKIDLPATSSERRKVWEPEQLGAFLDVAAQHRLGIVFEVAVFTGLRRGELVGLRWADIDLDRRELRVRQQRVQLGGRIIEASPKTRAGEDRLVVLDDQTIAALLAWQLTQETERAAWAEAYRFGGYVFTREDGTPLRPAQVSRVFEQLVERAGLPPMSLHGLRHQHASNLLAQGVDMAVISKRLGHSTLGITADLYSHLLRDANRAAADAGRSILPPRISTVTTVQPQTPSGAYPEGGDGAEFPVIPGSGG